MNWHRSKAPGGFQEPHEDLAVLRETFSAMEKVPSVPRKDKERIERWCTGMCHQLHAAGFRGDLPIPHRLTREGWQRYVDARFPKGRTEPVPAQAYGVLHPVIPQWCIQCHSMGMMQAQPSVPFLPESERTGLVDALARTYNGVAALPSTEGPDADGRQAFLETCYSCHSLELGRVVGDPRLPDFVAHHLDVKAPTLVPPDRMQAIQRHLRQRAEEANHVPPEPAAPGRPVTPSP